MNNNRYHKDLGDTYPIVIIKDRFGGIYSKAKWLAFNLEINEIPMEIIYGDNSQVYFWEYKEKYKNYNHHSEFIVGKGNNPHGAYYDLQQLRGPLNENNTHVEMWL